MACGSTRQRRTSRSTTPPTPLSGEDPPTRWTATVEASVGLTPRRAAEVEVTHQPSRARPPPPQRRLDGRRARTTRATWSRLTPATAPDRICLLYTSPSPTRLG